MIEEFIDAMADYHDAKREFEECQGRCNYDAGYFCSEYQQKVDDAKEAAEQAMRKIIRTELKIVN